MRESAECVRLVVSCEHGGCRVPPEFAGLFAGHERTLRSHRGWDPGALDVAIDIATTLAAPLVASTTTRLLIEINRSLGNPQVFSEFSRGLSGAVRERLVERFFEPHHDAVRSMVRGLNTGDVQAAHLSVHSFTDVLNGDRRDVDIGLLFDPSRASESRLCERLRRALKRRCDLRVRFNEPYRGTDDGLTTILRTEYADEWYAGIEIELRQGLLKTRVQRAGMAELLTGAIGVVLRRT